MKKEIPNIDVARHSMVRYDPARMRCTSTRAGSNGCADHRSATATFARLADPAHPQ